MPVLLLLLNTYLMNQHGNNPYQKSWRILYHQSVIKKDIPKLDTVDAERIKNAIENKIAVDPSLFGIPLRGTLRQFFKLRVGDWRIIYTTENNTVHILTIAHRKDVYGTANKRNQ
jgi:mRNA interferase RelE/StbE